MQNSQWRLASASRYRPVLLNGPDVPTNAADPSSLREGALAVLRENDLGGWTKPAPRLYPHQWSWDSGFHAIGLANVDPSRALRELETLFAAQWTDGRVPHIVFNPDVRDYFPDPGRWGCADVSDAAPKAPQTSGLVQPPVHAIATWHIWEVASEAERHKLLPRIRELYPKLLAWHRYLATERDPEHSGLITIYHPWEGTDNSPRWDNALEAVDVGEVPPYVRHDLKHVTDASERPSQAEYDRYLWLVECLKHVGYLDKEVRRGHPFQVKDILFSSIFAAANKALMRVWALLDRPAAEHQDIEEWEQRANTAVQQQWSAEDELALDFDMRSGTSIHVSTSAGLSPLLLPRLQPALAERLRRRLIGQGFAGAPGFAFRVVPSTSPETHGFRPRAYWRGPSWPVVDWLLSWGLRQQGFHADADALRDANLALLDRPQADFAEYFEPFTGEPLGSHHQSWTAAVTLDWLGRR